MALSNVNGAIFVADSPEVSETTDFPCPSPLTPRILKPDIMAPGTSILAAWPSKKPIVQHDVLFSDYIIRFGASYACPHVTGIAALLKAAHPEWSPAAIKSAIMTTADIVDNTFKPILDSGTNFQFASPLAMGSGHINPNRVLDPGLVSDVTPQDH
ncbi:Peptidase S8, subtilisin-related [Parasponia andersonii]|uniref:Peptidase S8, subtilisin-related n=1 Tax=Parasponia andersonii TaxID=3476 RepID=A0A2P5D4M9_PARAD|nr:Peptidase S8, subtilisin-related [Parasponia andersonii]